MDPNQIASSEEIDAFLAGATPAQALPLGGDMAAPPEVDAWLQGEEKKEKFGSLGQQVITGLEGAAASATFGLSTGVERALGVDPEAIRARREVNPASYLAGQAAGIVGSAVAAPAAGAAAFLTKAGTSAARAVGLGAAETAVAKIGSLAVRGAVENALVQSGDEVSKMLASDPTQGVETALTNVGLSGLLGGAVGGGFGTVSPLWKAASGTKLGGFLKAVASKANGIDGAVPSEVDEMIKRAGLEIKPELRAALSGDPEIAGMAKALEQSDITKSGRDFQATLGEFRKKVSERIAGVSGKTAEDVAAYSEATQGRTAMETFQRETRTKYEPISKEYDEITGRFKDLELPKSQIINDLTTGSPQQLPGAADEIGQKVAEMAQASGYDSPTVPQNGIVNFVLERLPKQNTLDDLSRLSSQVGKVTQGDSALWDVGRQLKEIILDSQQDILSRKLGAESPELFTRYEAVRGAYRDYAKTLNEAAQVLSLGKAGGTEGFLAKLTDKRSPEEFLRKLSPKGNADIIPFLQKNFPDTLKAVRENEFMKALKPAFQSAKDGHAVNPKALLRAMEKMSPEERAFVFPEKMADQVEALASVLEKYNELPHNFSNTARTWDKLSEYIPGTAVGMATMLAGQNPAIALILGGLTKILARDAPDAIKLGMLKFLGSSGPIDAAGFKSMVDMIQNMGKGEALVTNAARGVFRTTGEILPDSKLPSEKARVRLDKALVEMQSDPSPLLDVGGDTGAYLPNEAAVVGEVAARGVNYLNSLRPDTSKKNPLDADIEPSKAEKAAFNRALDIAEQPLIVLKDIKDGSVAPEDIVTLRTVYPGLYSRLGNKLIENMTNALAKGEAIPYKTKLGLSMFLGTPLDSTMTPQGIIAAQPLPQTPGLQMPEQRPKHSMASLDKVGALSVTPTQARETKRLTG